MHRMGLMGDVKFGFSSATILAVFLVLMVASMSFVSASVYEDVLVKSADFLMTGIDSSGTWDGGWHKKSYEDDNSLYDTEWDNGYTTGFSDDSVLATSNAIINLLKAYDATDDAAKKTAYLSAAQTAGDLLINVFIRSSDGHFEMTPVEAYMPNEVCCEWKTKIVKNFGTAWVMLHERTEGDTTYEDAAIAFGNYFLTEAGRDTNPASPYYGAIYTGQDRREDGVYQNGHHYIGSYSTGVIKSWIDIYGITGDSTYLDAAMLAAQAFIKYQFGSFYATKTTVQGWYTDATATPPDDADWAQMEGGFMFNRVDHGISRPETDPVTFATVSYTYYTSHLVKDLAVLHDELVTAGRTADATEIENSLIAFGNWIINSDVQDSSGYFNRAYSVSTNTWSVSNAEVRTTAPTARALLAVYEVTEDTDYLIAANKAVSWLLAEGHGYYPATGKESRYSNYIDVSYTSYSQVPFALAMAEAAESIPTEVWVDDDDVTCGGNSPCFDNIQDAIDAVGGSTVNVAAGTYNEDITIDTPLTLQSETQHAAVIDGGILINTDTGIVTIDGFVIENGAELYGPGSIGAVTIVGSDHVIKNNIFIGDESPCLYPAIHHSSGNNLVIDGNEMYDWCQGIYLNPSSGHVIENNNFHDNAVGIGSDGLSDVTIQFNDFIDNNVEVWSEGFGSSNVGNNVKVNYNNFVGNSHGVNHYGGNDIDAENNYWGCQDGPGEAGCDSVSANVDYDPWLSGDTDDAESTTSDDTVTGEDPDVDTGDVDGIDSLNFGDLPPGNNSVTVVKYNTTPENPPSDTGFEFAGSYYDINTDMADGTFNATIVFSYEEDVGDPGFVNGVPEENLKVSYYDGTDWIVIDGVLDTVANTYTITVDHFTPFSLIGTTSVDAYDITPDLARASEQDVGILKLEFTNAGVAADDITQIKVTSRNTADGDVQQVEIFEDTDDDGVFEPGTDDTSKGIAAFAGGVATVNVNINVPVGTQYVFVAYDTAAGAIDGNTLDAKIAAGDITMTNAGTNLGELDPAGETTIDSIQPETSTPTVSPDPYNANPTVVTVGSDARSYIAGAEYYINSDACASSPGTCNAMTASDGIFDELVEDVEAEIDISGLSDGQRTVYTRVKDAAGNWDLTVTGKTFTVDITKPTTALNAIATPTTQNTFTVSGTSTDTTTNVVNVQWKYSTETWAQGKATIADDGDFNSQNEDFHFDVGPLADGTYTINVRATDEATNVEDPAPSATFCIDTVNPDANIGGAYSGNEGSVINFNAGASFDPAPNCGAITIEWDLDEDGQYDDDTGTTSSKTWSDDGTYTIGIKVTDAAGLVDYDSTTVTVNNVAPTIDTIGVTGPHDEDDTATLTATLSDPGSDDDTLNYVIDWGDGTATTVSSTATDSISETHQYLDDDADDTYTITLTITDSDDATDVDTIPVTVANIAPVANSNGPYSCDEGDTIQLSASETDVGTQDTHTYAWDLDDDGFYDDGVTSTVDFVCNPDGVYSISVEVTDDDGGVDTDDTTVTVSNVAPSIDAIDATTPISEGSSTTFTATSTDPGSDDTPLDYDIDWGDGTVHATGTIASGVQLTQTHTYTDNNVYTITYTVTDSDLATDVETTPVTVNNVAPTVTAPADTSGDEGSLITIGTTSFTDPGADTYTATINWGDGSGDINLGAVTSPIATQSHVYADNGVYTVTVTATDDDAGVGDDTLTVTVANVAPVVDAGADQSVDEGDLVTIGPTFTDAGSADTHTATIDWGDGTATTTIDPAASPLSDTHTYADDGVYTVTVTVTDDDTGVGVDTLTVTVNDVDPVPNAGPDQIVSEGNTVTFDGSGSVAGDPNDAITLYTWDFGDGSAPVSGATLTAPTHVYIDNAVYTVTLTVTDEDSSASDTMSVTVNNVDPVVTVIQPNDGEKWSGTHDIEWTVTDPGDDTFTSLIEYYDGTSWTDVATGVETSKGLNTYSWDTNTGAFADSTNALIRVTTTDDDAGVGTDDSDAVFTVDNSPPEITYVNVDPTLVKSGDIIQIESDGNDPQGLMNCVARLLDSEYIEVQLWGNLGNDCDGERQIPEGLESGTYYVRVVPKNKVDMTASADAPITIDNTPPEMDSARTVTTTSIQVTFSEPLDEGSVDLEDFSIMNGNIPIDVTGADVNNALVTLTLADEIGVDDTPTVTLNGDGVDDLVGNVQTMGEVIAKDDISPEEIELSITLYKGWNFISIPKRLENPDVSDVLAGVEYDEDKVYRYDPVDGWSQAMTIEPLYGYWIYVNTPTVITLTFTTPQDSLPPSLPSRDLVPGWVTIGTTYIEEMNAEMSLVSIDPDYSVVIGWDKINKNMTDPGINGIEGEYSTEDFDMISGEGYWVFVIDETQLVSLTA